MNHLRVQKLITSAAVVAASFAAVILWLLIAAKVVPTLETTGALILVGSLLQLMAIIVLVIVALAVLHLCVTRFGIQPRFESRSTQIVLLALVLAMPPFVGGFLPEPAGFFVSVFLSLAGVYALIQGRAEASSDLDRN